mgnify:CR=1 FL=1
MELESVRADLSLTVEVGQMLIAQNEALQRAHEEEKRRIERRLADRLAGLQSTTREALQLAEAASERASESEARSSRSDWAVSTTSDEVRP